MLIFEHYSGCLFTNDISLRLPIDGACFASGVFLGYNEQSFHCRRSVFRLPIDGAYFAGGVYLGYNGQGFLCRRSLFHPQHDTIIYDDMFSRLLSITAHTYCGLKFLISCIYLTVCSSDSDNADEYSVLSRCCG